MKPELFAPLLPPSCTPPGLHALISTRHGGVSRGAFSSLNLGYHVKDDPACVSENRRRLAAAAGYDATSLVAAQQVHGATIAIVGAEERGRGAFGWDDAIADTDGLIVNEPGGPVAILVADCAPLLLVDPMHRVLAAVHAGWRGAAARIASAAVACMQREFDTDPARLVGAIGPSLCTACLEVGPEVAAQVRDVFGPTVIVTGPRQPHLDLAGMLIADLVGVGVPAFNITPPATCSRCRNDRYFSHRAQAQTAGRIALVAWWDQ